MELLKTYSALDLPANKDDAAVFPRAPVPYDVQCIRTVINSMEVGLASPLPGLSYFFYLKLPRIRRAFARKDLMLSNALKDSRDRLSAQIGSLEKVSFSDAPVRSAMDYVLRRELLQARKDGRSPRLDQGFDATVLKDELFGFLLAGHETTSTTLMWGMKFLSDYQDVQGRLKNALQEAIPKAALEARQPTYSEIVNSKCAYLDAVIEEILRCGCTASAHGRQCLVETELLGVRIPKGTNVLFMTNGPSFVGPSMPVDENLRSKTSREAKGNIGEWDLEGCSEFRPERWLTADSEDRVNFNLQAGPNTQFGGGARGCFGMSNAL